MMQCLRSITQQCFDCAVRCCMMKTPDRDSSSAANAIEEEDFDLRQTDIQHVNRAASICMDQDGLVCLIMGFLRVVDLLQYQRVSKTWKKLSNMAIQSKCCSPRKAITTNDELRHIISQYCTKERYYRTQFAAYMEEIALTYGYPIGTWDVSQLEDFSNAFSARYCFNECIDTWDVSNAKNMSYMFHAANNFNQPLLSWKTSNVRNMTGMFCRASKFNQPLGMWNISQVTELRQMFDGANSFNQNLSGWRTENVRTMDWMFANASSFNQSLAGWNTSNVTTMKDMFYWAKSFNQSLDGWDTSNITDMQGMFMGADSFNQPVDHFDTQNVQNMRMMFKDATAFNQSLGSWDLSNLRKCGYVLYNATSFRHWDTPLKKEAVLNGYVPKRGVMTNLAWFCTTIISARP